MKHETFFSIMWTVATGSVPGAVLGVVLVVALAFFVLGFVGSFVSFAVNQGRNLVRLYTDRQTLDLGELHPFTRSILENRCPEFARLRELAPKLKAGNAAAQSSARGILRNIEATLELYEGNSAVRNKILSSLQQVKV